MTPQPTPVPNLQAQNNNEASSSGSAGPVGVGLEQLNAILQQLNQANQAIADLRKEKDESYQKGLEAAANILKSNKGGQ